MNIPQKSSAELFDLRSAPVSASEVAAHFATDLLVASAYLLLIFIVVHLNRSKHVSIYVPRKTYAITFAVVLALTFGASVVSLMLPGLAVYLGYKVFVAAILLAVVLAIWRILPRHVDPYQLYRMENQNLAVTDAIRKLKEAEAIRDAVIASADSKLEARTAELTARKLALEKEVIEQRLAQERSEEARRRTDELILRTNTASAILTGDGEVRECNHALAQILGRRTSDEMVGRKIERLFGLKESAELAHFLNETLRLGTFETSLEVSPPARGSVHIDLQGVASILNGRPCVMVLLRDVTERKSSEVELLRGREAMTAALDVARKANATRSDFLAKMNHELRTPLNGIIGLAEIIRHKASGDQMSAVDARKLAMNIHQSGKHLLSVVDDLLDLSRLEAGTREFSPTRVSVRGEIDAALMTLATIALQKRIVLLNRCDAALEWTVDQRAFKQIIINLVNNAVKFSPPGSQVEIDVTKNAQSMALHIRDHGPGVSNNDMDRILTPFARGEYAETKKIDGVGLGLTIVSELLKLQGGRIEIESTPGTGSTFTAVFPAGADEDLTQSSTRS